MNESGGEKSRYTIDILVDIELILQKLTLNIYDFWRQRDITESLQCAGI